MDPPGVGPVAEHHERGPVAERGPRRLGLVGRVRGDLFCLSSSERYPEDLEKPSAARST